MKASMRAGSVPVSFAQISQYAKNLRPVRLHFSLQEIFDALAFQGPRRLKIDQVPFPFDLGGKIDHPRIE